MAEQEGIDAAGQVLGDFRTLFINTVDADAIVYELKNKDIIGDGDLTTITRTPGSTQKNSILHDCLLHKCDKDALMEICEVMIAVKGNPKMKRLGEEMKSALETRQVLGDFRTRFINTVDADAIVYELKNKEIIDDGNLATITSTPGSTQKNQKLHYYLLRKCDEDALMKVCEVMVAVKGNPNMKRLGEEMKSALERPAPQEGAQPPPQQAVQPPPQPQVVKTDLGSSVAGDTRELVVTKVVTLRDFGQNTLPPGEEWVVKYFKKTDSLQKLPDKRHEWELADTSHILMHIDIRNQQLYHLPLLITRIHCVYLVTFDLRNAKKALDTIRRTMKHISAFVSYDAECLLGNCLPSEVLLVGTHKEKLTDSQRSQFGKELHESLKGKHDDLIVKPAGDEEFWAIEGDRIGPHNGPLFEEITRHSCLPKVPTGQCIGYDEKLRHQTCHQGKKVIVKSNLPNYSSADTEKFLTFLHDYGFLVYCPYKELPPEDTTVVLEPQYLCQQFSEAQQLSKKKDGKATIADLFSRNPELQLSVKRKWFEKFCVHMGLVIEQPIKNSGKSFVFVFNRWLQSETVFKELPACSVAPLLVMCRLEDEDDFYIPPRFFAAFASMFPKHLQKKCKEPLCVRVNSLPSVQQSHIVVEWRAGCSILVVEQKSCIEIRFQLLCNSGCTAEEKLKKLQIRCQTVDEAVDESAKIAATNLTLPIKECVQYGFYHKCGKIGARIADDHETILECCCDCLEKQFTPMQKIWFQNVMKCKVHLQPHEAENRILELVEGPDPLQHTLPPQPNPQQQATPDRASHVLGLFRGRFISEVESKDIIHDLQHQNMITKGVLNDIEKESNKTLQNKKLYAHLEQTSTKDSLMAACNIMIAVAIHGNPKMKQFGEDLKHMVEGLP